MGELLAALIVIGILLGISYGVWSVVRLTTRALIWLAGELGIVTFVHCPWCGKGRWPSRTRCRTCGYPHQRYEGDLAAAARVLEHLRRTGLLDEERGKPLQQIIHTEQLLRFGFAHPDLETEPTPERTVEPISVPRPEEPSGPVMPQAPTVPVPEDVLPEPRSVPAEPIPIPEQTPVPRPVPDMTPATPSSTVPPAKALTQMLASFMEDKNIRWIELVAGLLIVVCSLGLVVSLWATLTEHIPYLPAMIFMTLTAAVHGAGLYTLKHWKLQATSQGLLVIATLLVPLNFMAIVILSEGEPLVSPYPLTCGALGLALFGWLTYQAGRVLLPKCTGLLLLAMIGTSASQLLIGPLAFPQIETWRLFTLAGIPLACYLAANRRRRALGQSSWQH